MRNPFEVTPDIEFVTDLMLSEFAQAATRYKEHQIIPEERSVFSTYAEGWKDGFRTAEIYIETRNALRKSLEEYVGKKLDGDMLMIFEIKMKKAFSDIQKRVAKVDTP